MRQTVAQDSHQLRQWRDFSFDAVPSTGVSDEVTKDKQSLAGGQGSLHAGGGGRGGAGLEPGHGGREVRRQLVFDAAHQAHEKIVQVGVEGGGRL